MALTAFLSVFDPSDLPGGSIDPLGFERGYLSLAELFLPDMTNVAECPRYYAMLAYGAMIARVDGLAAHAQLQRRHTVIMELERLWALANALAAAEDARSLSGLRGVRAAVKFAQQLNEDGVTQVSARFRMLADQRRYGVIGIYGAVATRCNLFYASGFEPTPELGEMLGDGFLEETGVPTIVQRVATGDDKQVPLETLKRWGRKAWLWGRAGVNERQALQGMIDDSPVRLAVCDLLKKYPASEDSELSRLSRIGDRLGSSKSAMDLCELIRVILAFESGYRHALLAFERLLYFCRQSGPAGAGFAAFDDDRVLRMCRKAFPYVAAELASAVDQSSHERLSNLGRDLADVVSLLGELAAASADSRQVVEVLLRRHTEIQHGKFDRGQRKTPWLELTNQRLTQTMSKVGGSMDELTKIDQIRPHAYRTVAADRWIEAAAGREHAV